MNFQVKGRKLPKRIRTPPLRLTMSTTSNRTQSHESLPSPSASQEQNQFSKYSSIIIYVVRYTVAVDENEIDMMMKIEIGSRIRSFLHCHYPR